MRLFRPYRWFADRILWMRHRLSVWLFENTREHASAWMAALLVVPLWGLLLAWMTVLIVLTFGNGLSAPLPPFMAMMIAIAIPFELLCRWWRHLKFPLDMQEGRELGDMLHRNVRSHLWKVDPLLGPWRPHLRLEKWMIVWAFDESCVRDAVASRLRSQAQEASGNPKPRRL